MERSVLKFEEAIKSEATKRLYRSHLKSFLQFTKIKDPDGLLQLKDSFLQELLEDYLFSLKKRLNPNSVPQRFTAIELFFSMNDKILNFKKIKKMYPAPIKSTGRDYWSTSDVKKMLAASKTKRMTAFIHLLASTGCRFGAIESLKLKDLKDIENCKAIVFYAGAIEEYIGFLTPEASLAMDDYLSKRRADGEIITPDSPLFRKMYSIGSSKVRPANAYSLKVLMLSIEKKANLVRTRETYSRTSRFNIQLFHGFRKRFNNILKDNSEGNISLKEKLMGHKGAVPLDGTYHNPKLMILFEEFKIHIPNLTIDESERQKLELAKKDREITELRQREIEIVQLKKNQEVTTRWMIRFKDLHPEFFLEND